MRLQMIGLWGVVERNAYLIKRYGWWELAFLLWTVANTLTIVFIAKGVQATGGHLDLQRATTTLLIGAVIWSYLGIIFEILTETVAWERWEGTIEYTFMAPLSRAVHLGGMGLFAVLYGVVRTAMLFAIVALFFGLHFPQADFLTALVLLAVGSISFVGIGMITAVLPLISPEKGAQLGSRPRASCSSSRASTTRCRCCRSGCSGWRSLPGHLRAARDPRRDPQRRSGRRALGRHLATARARGGLHSPRAAGVRRRRALRQAPREAETLRLIVRSDPAGPQASRPLPRCPGAW